MGGGGGKKEKCFKPFQKRDTECVKKDLDLTLVIEARWLFVSLFWPLLKRAEFFLAAGVVTKNGLSLK